MAPVLGYWNVSGRAQTIRYLLAYSGTEFKDKTYDISQDSGRKEWVEKDKHNLGLTFPNLPYYIDDKVKLTQSMAIMRYLAKKHNLCGSNEEEHVLVMQLEEEGQDMKMALAMTAFTPRPAFEKKKEDYDKALPAKLKWWSDYLGNKKYMAGDKVTYVDFIFYETFRQMTFFTPGCLDNVKNIGEYVKRIENLPAIAKFRSSPNYIEKPFFGPMATWNP